MPKDNLSLVLWIMGGIATGLILAVVLVTINEVSSGKVAERKKLIEEYKICFTDIAKSYCNNQSLEFYELGIFYHHQGRENSEAPFPKVFICNHPRKFQERETFTFIEEEREKCLIKETRK